MDNDKSADQESQNDEMMALESILDPKNFKMFPGAPPSGQINIDVSIPETFAISMTVPDTFLLKDLNIDANPDDEPTMSKTLEDNRVIKVDIRHLPPLVLHFTMPYNYPSEAKPAIILSSKWLDRRSLSILCRKLDQLWDENQGMAVLYLWYSTLKEETFTILGMQDLYDISWWLQTGTSKSYGENVPVLTPEEVALGKNATCSSKSDSVAKCSPSGESQQSSGSSKVGESLARVPRSSRNSQGKRLIKVSTLDKRAVFDGRQKDTSLWDFLISYDQEERNKEFQTRSHSCAICLMEKTGTDCFQFSCQHVFCQHCIREYFNTHILEGSIASLKCPEIKCKTVPTHAQVRMAVSEELFLRYDDLLLKRTLESMSDILYCPRPDCGSPVIADPNDKLALCNKCNYTFCSICRMVYHGVEPCRFRTNDKKIVYQKYMTGTEDDKKKLELTYGKKQLNLLIQTVMSEEWVQSRSKPCPHCSVPIEKFEGCNKVTCYKCNTYFCWKCLTHLDHGNPYFHFNDPNSKCYTQLFWNVEDEDEEWEAEDDWTDEEPEWHLML